MQNGKRKHPGGRPKGSRNKSTQDIRALIDKCCDVSAVIGGLARLATSKDPNVAAAKILLEYRFGKPTETMNVNTTINPDSLAEHFRKVVSASHTSITPQQDNGVSTGSSEIQDGSRGAAELQDRTGEAEAGT